MILGLLKIIFLSVILVFSVKFTYNSVLTLLWRNKTGKISQTTECKSVSIIIPARNEELNIKECLCALETLKYDNTKLEVIVVNDSSTDSTASIVQEFVNKNSSFRMIDAPSLPSGWMGKNHACFVGAKEAKNEILLFIDADVKLLENALIKTTSYLIQNNAKLLSLTPSQVIKSIGERLFLPGMFLAISESMNFYKINDQNSKQAVANGQFMMFDKESFLDLGDMKE